ncbi:MAG TPA: N,N-dimethylformamidase beta subunit family domain-containing protein, partial [Humisphaera sp.]|nr:N,N-dimethylformamidase beta subunit family domain-containing protein [Humisphaera sp.]
MKHDDCTQPRPGNPVGRRALLKAATAAAAAATLPASLRAVDAPTAEQSTGAIARENSKPGTSDWQLTYVRPEKSGAFRSRLIEGYCSHVSIRAGDTLQFHLSSVPASAVTIDIYRMGYYQGLGGRHVTTIGPVDVKTHEAPAAGEYRLRECNWPAAAEFKTPADWVSGVYLAKLSSNAHRYQSYVVFIVRDDRKADLLFQCSTNTWQAYNKWPTNDSLYDTDAPNKPLNGTTRVSFDRPYGMYPQVVDQPLSMGSGEFLCWEFPLCFWLESHGYDVTYIGNHDTHCDAAGLKRGRVFLSVGHDEYWTLEMFGNVQAAVDSGVSAAFLSGNTCCFVAPLAPSSDGRPDRVFHRAGRYGGLMEIEKAQMGPFDLDGHALPNERSLIGARTVSPFNGSGDWAVAPGMANHWLFEGTGIQEGDRIDGLVGWEFHGDPAPIPGLQVVASAKTTNGSDKQATFMATVYPGPKGNWVFNAATIFWAMG